MNNPQHAHRASTLRSSGWRIVFDVAAWVIAVAATVGISTRFAPETNAWPAFLLSAPLLAGLQVILGHLTPLYRDRHPVGSVAEARLLGVVMVATGAAAAAVLVALDLLTPMTRLVPLHVILIATPVALVLASAMRLVLARRRVTALRPDDAERAIVYGAGMLGEISVRRMNSDPASPYVAVGLIDDDPQTHRRAVEGVRVSGTLEDLGAVAADTDATTLIIAIARADAELLQRATDAATAAGLRTKVYPPLSAVLSGNTRLADLRDIEAEDLIGRRPIDTEIEHVASYLRGKRVLVTGAGGSIGSELCRQIHRFGPAELIMLDRDETALQAVQITIHGNGLLDSDEIVLADIRDRDTMHELFADRRPHVVFHAAALKHLPMLEQYPDEAWKTNVLGTLNVLDAADAAGVPIVVNISTDKAANPTSVLGTSKRLAERLTAWKAETTGQRYLSVRFGNVFGSRGSMLPTFTKLIEDGKPLTITHPDVTRFFMTIPEACQLVIQAGGIGTGGEVLVLDMGEPVRILDIAKRMIELSGKDVGIVYTGLREGEKLHEELLGDGELDERPMHPLISHTSVPALTPDELAKLPRLDAFATEGTTA